ncbi:MAG: hypothetical protein KJ792_13460 [Actinobacteria bacterium]|nr:hypothetical protein [Actinomycetota bacterium]MCG2801205.1 hypothetical protein [Cellulomonas sp.]
MSDQASGGQASGGPVIASRYRLGATVDDDIPGALTYAAVDVVLDRPIQVRLLPSATPGALDAARRAALVTDVRLVRIVDVGTLPDGRGYVVTQDAAGPSLAELLAAGPLSADQARAVIGEAAAALEVARRRGVHHLALRPSALHITRDGRVVISGLSLDAHLLGRTQNDEAASRTDAVDLLRLLYAALTGTWPVDEGSTAPVRLPAAPRDASGDLVTPRTTNPEVPADLSALCIAGLVQDDDGPRTAGELVHELEPWGEIRVQTTPGAGDAATAVADAGPPRTRVPRESIRAAFERDRPSGVPGTPPPAPPQLQHGGALPPVDAPAAGQPPVTSSPPAAPLSFAATPPPGAPAWTGPPSAAGGVEDPFPAAVPRVATSSGRGPSTYPVPVVTSRAYGRGRRIDPTRTALVVAVVVILVAVVLGLTSLFSSPTTSAHTDAPAATTASSTPSSSPTSSRSASPTPSPSASAGAVVAISSVTTYDPADPDGEHQESIQKAIDGDPATAWNTRTYKSATFGGLKPGVAVQVTLAATAQVTSVTLATTGTGGQVEIRASSTSNPEGGAVLASGSFAGTTTLKLDPALDASSFVIWISQLPTTSDGSYRLELSEITVR